jgi:hypothetical protein
MQDKQQADLPRQSSLSDARAHSQSVSGVMLSVLPRHYSSSKNDGRKELELTV